MAVYDEIEIEDMDWKADERVFYYPCPCGDKFSITLDELLTGEEIARCPSCSLRIRVVYDADELEAKYAAADGGGRGEPALVTACA